MPKGKGSGGGGGTGTGGGQAGAFGGGTGKDVQGAMGAVERLWIPLAEVSKGMGALLADDAGLAAGGAGPVGSQGFAYGDLLTLFPGQLTLPLLVTATTPTGITSDRRQRACIAQVWDQYERVWVTVLAKGPKVWRTTGVSWTDVSPS